MKSMDSLSSLNFWHYLQDLITFKESLIQHLSVTCIGGFSLNPPSPPIPVLPWLFSCKEKIDQSLEKNSARCQSDSSIYKLQVFVMDYCEISTHTSFWLLIHWNILFLLTTVYIRIAISRATVSEMQIKINLPWKWLFWLEHTFLLLEENVTVSDGEELLWFNPAGSSAPCIRLLAALA